ncbi:MAG: hypothetical protein IVW52_11280 [Acidimicrobiales bacterium]|nr:hypothetical protein [Acidimicrobiales bacterium]
MRMTAAGAVSWVRIGVGLLLAVAPGMFVRRFVQDEASGSLILFTRTVGVRDLALGLGSLAAVRSESTDDVRRWVRAGLISDSLDLVAGLASSRLAGRRGVAIATATVLPVIALDALALRQVADSAD